MTRISVYLYNKTKKPHFVAALRDNISLKVTENTEYTRIYLNLIEPMKRTSRVGKRSLERLEHQVRFKLGWIIYLLQRLSDALESKYLSRRALLDVITATALDNVNQQDIEHKKVELDVLNLNEIMQQDQEKELVQVGQSVYYIGSSSELSQAIRQYSRDRANSSHVLTSMYLMAENPDIEYSEDIVASIEKEIQIKFDEMRTLVPVPVLAACISELKLCFVKQWLKMYERDL